MLKVYILVYVCACFGPWKLVVFKFGRWISPKDAFGIGKVLGGSTLLPSS